MGWGNDVTVEKNVGETVGATDKLDETDSAEITTTMITKNTPRTDKPMMMSIVRRCTQQHIGGPAGVPVYLWCGNWWLSTPVKPMGTTSSAKTVGVADADAVIGG